MRDDNTTSGDGGATNYTTVSVRPPTRDRLRESKPDEMTYDEYVGSLLDRAEEHRQLLELLETHDDHNDA